MTLYIIPLGFGSIASESRRNYKINYKYYAKVNSLNYEKLTMIHEHVIMKLN
jgi:hypothetical protein